MNSINTRYTGFEDTEFTNALNGNVPNPTILEVHPSASCQLRCEYCHSYPFVHCEKHDLLSLLEYTRIFEEFSALGGKTLIFSGGGEPLLYSDILGLLALAHSFGFLNHLYTNGLQATFFSPVCVEDWLHKVQSIRISLHRTAWLSVQSRLKKDIKTLLACKELGHLSTNISIAILVDTFQKNELRQIATEIATWKVDCIELRHVIPYRSLDQSTVQFARQILIDSGCEESKVDTRQIILGLTCPEKCFALYRNIIIDPVGGIHSCCMNAHLGTTDPGFIGSFREISLSDALRNGAIKSGFTVGAGCIACSARDLYFSTAVVYAC
jgi:MoaA/NifB/PqqE/SkfB family radical SAM enzyme